jgi:LysR family nitrogen assimilation transcriptional regulator
MDVHQLQLLLAVIECASVTKAAAKVNLSPGAISQQLHNLAAELRTELFVRAGKRLQPTPAALRLAEQAQAVVRQMEEMRREFAGDPSTDTRPFHFATGATALIHSLGKPLRLLRRNYPKTQILVTVSTTEEMVAGLLDRRFDLALISLPFPEHDLVIHPLFDEELLVLRHSPTRVSGWHVGTMQPAELAQAPFLLYPPRSNMRTIIDAFFRKLGFQPKVLMQADDTEALKRLVEYGFGYSMLPEYALRRGPRFFQTFRVAGHRVVRHQALALARTPHPRPLTTSIAQFLASALAKEK